MMLFSFEFYTLVLILPNISLRNTCHTERLKWSPPSSPQLASLFTFWGPWRLASILLTPAALGHSDTRTIIKPNHFPHLDADWETERTHRLASVTTDRLPAECNFTPRERDWIQISTDAHRKVRKIHQDPDKSHILRLKQIVSVFSIFCSDLMNLLR